MTSNEALRAVAKIGCSHGHSEVIDCCQCVLVAVSLMGKGNARTNIN